MRAIQANTSNLVKMIDTPELAADTVSFLTSERRDWLAGRYISCTWDMPELLSRKDEIVDKNLLKLRMNFGLS